MSFWNDFWSQKTDGLHRYKTEDFFRKQAKEVSYHLEGGNSLLDFGCGSAELLVYYAGDFETVTGVDFSQSMLGKAEQRIADFNISNVQLLHGDEDSAWGKIDRLFDRIIACGVVQYLTYEQVDHLVCQASSKLADGGKIVLFTFIEPSILFLRKIDVINKKRSFFGICYKIVRLLFHVINRKMRQLANGSPIFEIGYAYRPAEIQKLADKYGLNMDLVWSMYYEYRYHVVLTKNSGISK